jgi:hypothetical protein
MAIPKGWALDTARNISAGESYFFEDKITGVFNADKSSLIDTNIVVTVNQKNGTITFFEQVSFGRREPYLVINASGTRDSKFKGRYKDLVGPKQTQLEEQAIKAGRLIAAENKNKEESKKVLSEKLYAQPVPETNPERDPGESEDEDGDSNQKPSGLFKVTSNTFFQRDGKFINDFLKYPIDINSKQDRITITQKRYKVPDIFNEDGSLSSTKIIRGSNLNKERFDPTKTTPSEILGSLVLPMPNDISESNVTAWGSDSLSSLTALVGQTALKSADKITNFDIEGLKTTLGETGLKIFTEGEGANETIKQLLAINAAAAITKKFGININPEAFRSRITGTAINPNLELLFQGPKLRSFGFQFKMTPRDDDEARNIRYILKFFKKGMAPKRNFTDQEASYFLGAPNVFDLSFKSDDNIELNSIGKIKTCALQQFTVNYTPDGFYAAFKDSRAGGSQPIAVVMQLAFTELTPLYNDNYEEKEVETTGFDTLEPSTTQQ